MSAGRSPGVEPILEMHLADPSSMGAAGEAVRAIADSRGLPAIRSTRIEAVVEELVREAFEREVVTGSEEVIVEVAFDGGSLWVSVLDHRLPLDPTEARHLSSNRLAVLGFVDALHVSFRGGSGNVVHLEARLAGDLEGTHEQEEGAPGHDATEEMVDSVQIRRMVPDDAPNLIRCLYRSYGYSYPDPSLYDVHAIRRLLATERMLSIVAVLPDGEIVGHVALVYEEDGDLSPESGRLVVDPRLRGHHFTTRLGKLRAELAEMTGIVGTWSKAVTNHAISQHLAVDYGATEVGLLIGAQPTEVVQVGLPNPEAGWRSLMLLYRPATSIAPRQCVVPSHLVGIVGELVELTGIPRHIEATIDAPTQRRTSLKTHLHPEHGLAMLRMRSIGRDLRRRVIHELRGLAAIRPAAVHFDIPLSDPSAAWAAHELEHLGFCWAGWIPELTPAGDVLRYQRVGDHRVDIDHIEVATDHGASMREFTLAEWHRVKRARLTGV